MSTIQKDIVNALLKGVLSLCGIVLTWLYFDMKNDIEKISNKQDFYMEKVQQVEVRQSGIISDIKGIQRSIDKLER